jgi:hypothetical protein
MNIHTLMTVLIIISGVLLILMTVTRGGVAFDRQEAILLATFSAAAVLFLGSICCSIFIPWYSPIAAKTEASLLSQQLDKLRPPTKEYPASAQVNFIIDTLTTRPVAVHRATTNHFTIALSGDTALTCLTYNPMTTYWSWTPGACT